MTAVAVAQSSGQSGGDLAQQPIGRVGMWWFLASEIMVFGGLIGSFILHRIAAGGWAAEAEHVSTTIAAFNTLLLVTSSLTIVQAHAAVEAGDRQRARRYLLITVLFGCSFLGVKGFEYSREIAHGFTPTSGLFWSFYYAMTGLHGLHVLAGVIANFALFAALTERGWPLLKQRVEYAGLYWHFVDVVWIFLFPLVYLS